MPLHKTLSAAVAALCLLLAGKTVHANDPTLTIYTYDSFVSDWGPGPVVKKAFEAECGCTLNWVGIADGVALLNRLKLEGKSSKADIVLGLDTNLIAEAAATGLFTSHETDLSNVDVPGGWADKTFIPYDYGYFAFVYDTDAIKTPPTSLRELVDGDPDVKIAIQDPRTATPGLGLLLWVKAVYGDDAPKAWKKLKDRVLTVTPGWSEAYGLFTNGEVPMVLSYTTSPAYHMVAEETDRYQAAGFEEGHYMQIEVAGMLEGSGQKELARKFLSFMTSPGFQNAIPTTNWMFPAAAVSEPVPAAFDTLVKPTKTLLFSPQHVLENRKAWVDEWLSVMSR